MTDKGRPKGQLFTDIYRVPGPPVADSARARKRLGHFLASESMKRNSWAIYEAVKLRFGVVPNTSGMGGIYWDDFVPTLKADDFLNFLTLAYQCLLKEAAASRGSQNRYDSESYARSAREWLEFARDVLASENLAFEMDDRGGVHPKIDSEFQSSKNQIIRSL